ncbi:hypothetical protein [Rhodococcus kronopolitis]|uniref:DUF5709 domain-containing protein n=1 Tax=Rhodococcus kronopolitis TaxID=1460226 RepID=A0ABV9FXU5_9NOCA
MDDDESLFTGSEAAGAMPPVPEDVWARALAAALDPAAPAVDADLVPEIDDEPVVPYDDGDIVLVDDEDVLDDDGTEDVVLDDGDPVFDDDPLPAPDLGDAGVSGQDTAGAFDPQEADLHHDAGDPDPGFDLL